MTHIILELRNYKKQLVDKMDCSRRSSTSPVISGDTDIAPAQTNRPSNHLTNHMALPDLIRSPETTKPPRPNYISTMLKNAKEPRVRRRTSDRGKVNGFGGRWRLTGTGKDLGMDLVTGGPAAALQLSYARLAAIYQSTLHAMSCAYTASLPFSLQLDQTQTTKLEKKAAGNCAGEGHRSTEELKYDEHGALDLSVGKLMSSHQCTPLDGARHVTSYHRSVASQAEDDFSRGRHLSERSGRQRDVTSSDVKSNTNIEWPAGSLFSAPNLERLLKWTVKDVVDFAAKVPGCCAYIEVHFSDISFTYFDNFSLLILLMVFFHIYFMISVVYLCVYFYVSDFEAIWC